MSFWQRYRGLSQNTRVLVGVGIMAYASFAMYASDSAEGYFGLKASEDDMRQAKRWLPSLSAVEREEREKSKRSEKG